MRELYIDELEAVVGGCDQNLDPNSPDYEEEREASCQNPREMPKSTSIGKKPKWKPNPPKVKPEPRREAP